MQIATIVVVTYNLAVLAAHDPHLRLLATVPLPLAARTKDPIDPHHRAAWHDKASMLDAQCAITFHRAARGAADLVVWVVVAAEWSPAAVRVRAVMRIQALCAALAVVLVAVKDTFSDEAKEGKGGVCRDTLAYKIIVRKDSATSAFRYVPVVVIVLIVVAHPSGVLPRSEAPNRLMPFAILLMPSHHGQRLDR